MAGPRLGLEVACSLFSLFEGKRPVLLEQPLDAAFERPGPGNREPPTCVGIAGNPLHSA